MAVQCNKTKFNRWVTKGLQFLSLAQSGTSVNDSGDDSGAHGVGEPRLFLPSDAGVRNWNALVVPTGEELSDDRRPAAYDMGDTKDRRP